MSEPQPSLLARVRARKLFQWAVAYVAGAWLVLQLLDVLTDRLGWPDVIFRAAIVLLAVGLLGALVLAWYHGERGEQRATGIELGMLAGIFTIAAVAVMYFAGTSSSTVAGDVGVIGVAPHASSIAVIPFVNMSGDAEQEYFSDGLTEELLNVLAQQQGLRVASRTSSFAYKDSRVPVDSIARALRVAHVLEGSVRRDGDQIRITAQLIKADDGYHVWSETYDRQLASVFAVQDEISRAIVSALREHLNADVAPTTVRAATANVEAYELYLKGRHQWHRLTEPGFERAADYFRQAIALDPTFARAHLGLADALIELSDPAVRAANMTAAKTSLARALELEPDLAGAHTTMGYLRMIWDQDIEGAGRAFRRAFELDPHDAFILNDYGWYLLAIGRTDEGLEHLRSAVQLEPVTFLYPSSYARALLDAGRAAEALPYAQAALELEPTSGRAHTELGTVYRELGRFDEAIRWQREGIALDYTPGTVVLAHTLALAGQRDEARRILEQAAHDESFATGQSMDIGMAYGALGEHDIAFRWLERAVRERHDNIMFLASEHTADPLRGDPRFRQVLDRLGIPR